MRNNRQKQKLTDEFKRDLLMLLIYLIVILNDYIMGYYCVYQN